MKTLTSFFLSVLICMTAFGQVTAYNSNPSSVATIYLDFDGQYVQGTSWNMGGSAINCAPAGISASQIKEVFQRVSEDYRPFDINVTTDSTKYWAAPIDRRIRIILTTTSDWYGNAGGVSYMGSFTWGDNTPGFVFTALLNYVPKYIAEAASHEVGHTLGLKHQAAYDNNCNKLSEYNTGIGSGEIGWAPIMGSAYYKNFTLWNNGANPYGCTNYQNDLEIITGYNGFTYRADDYTADFKKPTKVSFTNDKFSLSGIIEKSTDVDVVSVTIPSFGRFKLDAEPYNIGDGYSGANLDLEVDLMSNATTVLGTYNPASTLKSGIDTMLNAGIYYLRLQGKGNSYTSAYASLGSYNLLGQFGAGIILPLHKLELHGIVEKGQHKLDWDIEAEEAVVKQTLEVSTNGQNFQVAAQPGSSERTYNYFAGTGTNLYYRLNVEFDNGRQYYSNIVSLGDNKAQKPSLVSNLVRGNLTINSPGLYNYSIIDLNGRLVSKGSLSQGINTISTSTMNSGMFIIQYLNDNSRFAEKFIRQ
jgi:hypothetical protein